MRSRRNLGMKQDKNHFLVILAIYFLIFLTMAVSPYVIVSGYDNSLSRILIFESLMTTGSLTLAHSQNSQMSFMYGFFFVKFLFFTVVCVVIVI